MKIVVFGAGGVGGYFGGRMAQAGLDVSFVARGEHLKAIQESGLTVKSIKGDFHLNNVKAESDPQKVGLADVVFVCTKAWQVKDAAKALKPIVGPETIVVPLQNGVDGPAELKSSLDSKNVLGGFCAILAQVSEPGVILHSGYEPILCFNELDQPSSQRVENLKGALSELVGTKVATPKDINVGMWTKFIFISAWSGLAAITRQPLAVIREQKETRELIIAALNETYQVGLAAGVALPEDIVTQTLEKYDAVASDAIASMQRDIMAGYPSELDFQNGAVVRIGNENGVATPVNSFIYDCLLPAERLARKQS